MNNCIDLCQPGFIPGPIPPYCVSGCALSENPTFKTYILPKDMGTDAAGQPFAPKDGAYTNAIVVYAANDHVYLYDSQGKYTLVNTPDNTAEPTPSVEVVQETGTSLAAVMSQNAVTEALREVNQSIANTQTSVATLESTTESLSAKVEQIVETGTGPEVVQGLGNSTDSVMSQNAVTEQITKVENTFTSIDNNMVTLSSQVSELETKVGDLEAGGTTVEVVQTTGSSTTAVMSQKAVSDLVGDVDSLLVKLDTGAGV